VSDSFWLTVSRLGCDQLMCQGVRSPLWLRLFGSSCSARYLDSLQ